MIESVASMDTPDVDGFCQVTARVMAGDSASDHWSARTEDPKRNIWTVQCLTEKTSVTTQGKEATEEILFTFLYDVTEERLHLDDNWAKMCWNLGIEMDLSTSQPSIPVPYAAPSD